MRYAIKCNLIVTPDEILENKYIIINNNIIEKIENTNENADFEIKLDENDIVFPALINIHDHLLGTYFPRVGNGPYLNWLPWDDDLKSAPVYIERSKIPNSDLYLLGAYKNLVSGVTTVQDHIPHFINQDLLDTLPIRTIRNYALQHECSSYDLKWGDSLTEEFKKAVENNIPFITHIEEGFDEEATLGIDILKYFDALNEYTVLIHGIAFSDNDIKEISKRKANVVWCPYSNFYMFKTTTNIRLLLKENVNVSLGTDSTMSGSINILEEMKFATKLYKEIYNEELDPKILIKMVTTNPAKALRINNLGTIKVGNIADLLVINNSKYNNPYEALVNSWFDNIKIVIMDGIPIYTYEDYEFFIKKFNIDYEKTKINGKNRLIKGSIKQLYERIWNYINYKKILPFLPLEAA